MPNNFNKIHEVFDQPNRSYVSTTQSYLDVYNERFEELMQHSKEDLVKMIIGERPICGPSQVYWTTTPYGNFRYA